MAHEAPSAASIRSLLVGLTAQDWEQARAIAPDLEDALRRAAQLHRSQPVFGSSGKLTTPVVARLGRLPARRLVVAVNPLLVAAADAQAGLEVRPRLTELAAHCADLGLPKRRTTSGSVEDSGQRLQELAAELQEMQAPVLTAVEAIRARIQDGQLANTDDLLHIDNWQALLADAARLLGLDSEEVSVAVLADAARSALLKAEAERKDDELRRILSEIAEADYGSKARARLQAIAEQARHVDLAHMTEESKEAFRALHRLMRTPAYSADQHDAELVQAAFGFSVLLAAAGAMLAHAEEPEPPSPAPEAPQAAESHPQQDEPQVTPPEKESARAAPPVSPVEPAELTNGLPDRRITDAVTSGRPGLAYWYAVALDLPTSVQAVFEVLALSKAITTGGDDCSMRIRVLLQDFDVTAVAYQQDYLKVLVAGCIRALLRLPFSPCAAVLNEAATLIEDRSVTAFVGAVQRAAAFGLELGRFRGAHDGSLPELIARRDSALSALSSALNEARQLRTRYARATSVWRRLVGDKGPLGGPVAEILAKPDCLQPAERLLAQLRDLRAIDRLIDEYDTQLNPVAARRSRIIAGAREDLRQHTADLLAALQRYLEAARAATARQGADAPDQLAEAVEHLTQAVESCGDEVLAAEVGAAALMQVKRWLRNVLITGAPLPGDESSASAVLARDLARCFEVRRLDDGTVAADSVTTQALDAAQGRSAEVAYEGFVARDDHVGAEQLIDVLREEGHADVADRLAERQQEDRAVSRERLREMLADTERELARALSAALLSESETAERRAELERLRDTDITDFPAAKLRLRELLDTVAEARQRAITHARQQLAALDCPEPVRDRIGRELDEGDLVNAQEFLAQLATGAAGLPAEAQPDQTLTEFWPDFAAAVQVADVSVPADQRPLAWLEEAASSHGNLAGRVLVPADASSLIGRGLRGWLSLTRSRRGGVDWQRSLKDVLQLLGLEVTGHFTHGSHGTQRWWTEFQGSPVGHPLVPAYGSGCRGRYQLLLCWDKMSSDKLLDLIDEGSAASPVIVLHFRTLAKPERRSLAERSRARRKKVTAVVIDNTVIVFLATRTETRLQTAMAVTLPFTAVNPYTPFVLGDVPREVFYGRREELRRVQDANEALFVYGGRQLGKSALLKTAMREFAQTDDRWRSVYVDLNAEGIGAWREPDDIWQVLVPHLQSAEILDDKVSTKAGPDVVVTQIRRWLDADSERRILLLLDESDAFLATDARARKGPVGEARFPNVYRLKGLMDGSGRRFKPVFAGLHQVQRAHTAGNGPMAHVGAEILVGPLPPAEAYKLVVRPLAAIGYRVESPDVAWRLLAYTNYQASLIQLFCDALVRRLHPHALAGGAPPTVITDRDIDEVYADKDVRSQIAERFELTINLDSRYRVIAYTAAWLTINSDSQAFAAITLYDYCNISWSAGFADLTLDDFASYLDEMVGLGVLVRTPAGDYGIRSPNVIRLLGTKEEIERRLEESDRLELSRPFDPADFRRALGAHPDRRSPLSEQQVQQILDGGERIHVVVGSAALGLDRVGTALREAAPEGTEVRESAPDSLAEVMSSFSRTKNARRHVVLNLNGTEPSDQHSAVLDLQRRVRVDSRLSASCIAPPEASWIWQEDAPQVSVELVRIKPWTDDALRAWAPECEYPLATTEHRSRLLEATGGWPDLVEAAASRARAGVPEARACQEAMAMVGDASRARQFLLAAGLSADPVSDEAADVASTWSEEITFDDLATLVDADREAVLAAILRLVDLAVLTRGSSGDTYRINPLIARLLRGE